MSKADDIFWKEFGVILLLLTLFAVCMFILARSIGANTFEKMQSGATATTERIAPFGQVRVGDPTKQAQAPAEQVASVAPATGSAATQTTAGGAADAGAGEKIYQQACMACHATGIAKAPKLGDKAAWEPRVSQGIDVLLKNAIAGKGAMPPKGGWVNPSDDQIKSAVTYMLGKAGLSPG